MSRAKKAHKPDRGRGLRRQAVVDRLLKEIVQGRLRPGQRLVVQTLSESLGLGVMPIREALMVLTGIGVVEMRPNRGAVVRGLRPVEVRGIYLVRRALECEAVRTACGRIGTADLRALHDDLSRLIAAGGDDRASSVKKTRAVDSRLHDLIATSCGNPFLRDEIERLKLLYRFLRDLAYEQEGPINNYFRKELEAREHLAIVEALMAGDNRLAVRAMSRHILSSLKYFSEVARRIQSQAATDGWSAPWSAAAGGGEPTGRRRGSGTGESGPARPAPRPASDAAVGRRTIGTRPDISTERLSDRTVREDQGRDVPS